MLDLINTLNGWAWGPPMLILIALTGIYLTIGLKAYPLLNIRRGFVTLWTSRHRRGTGEISGFNTDQGNHPHPENRSRTTQRHGGGDARNITGADGGRE